MCKQLVNKPVKLHFQMSNEDLSNISVMKKQ